MTEAPTIEERYARAMTSSHLEVTEHPGDVDKLIAAGWVRDGLSTTLYRLRMEYDSARAEQQRAEQNQRRMEHAANSAPKELPPRMVLQRGETEPLAVFRERQRKARESAAGMTREEATRAAGRGAITARLLLLMRLKTLERAKVEMADYARERAQRGRHMTISDPLAETIAGRVLDVWLDPNCHHCDGRGFNGGSHRGEAQTICRPCRGSGKRREWVGRSLEEQAFVHDLFTEIGRMLGTVGGRMRRFLSQRDGIA